MILSAAQTFCHADAGTLYLRTADDHLDPMILHNISLGLLLDGSGGEPDATEARRKTLALLDRGAGIINYIGHSHQWQWAITDMASSTPYLLRMPLISGISIQEEHRDRVKQWFQVAPISQLRAFGHG